MHEFKPGDPVYILFGQNGQTQRIYGKVTETWSSGRIVDIQFDRMANTWPFMAIHVYHAEQDTNTEVSSHVLC